MLLSFSVDYMRPMIEAGIKQEARKKLPKGTRVKRQTIRARGPVAERLLRRAGSTHHIMAALDLWWKSRTKTRAKLGYVMGFHVYPIVITHLTSGNILIDGLPKGALCWPTNQEPDAAFTAFARADGFETAKDFMAYFVPNPADEFIGILYKW